MSLDDCIFLDDTFPALYQPLTLDTYPAEGDQEALATYRFVQDWDGHRALALLCSRCRAPGKTGLMVGVYKALLPRVQADLHHGAWVQMLEFADVAEDPHQRFGPVAERAYPGIKRVAGKACHLDVWLTTSCSRGALAARARDAGRWLAGLASRG